MRNVCRSSLLMGFHLLNASIAYSGESLQIAKQFCFILFKRNSNCAGLIVYRLPFAFTSIQTDSPSGPLPQRSGKPGETCPDKYAPAWWFQTAFASTMFKLNPSFVSSLLISKTTGPSLFSFFFRVRLVFISRFANLFMAEATRFL